MRIRITHYRPDGPDPDSTIDLLRLETGQNITPQDMGGYIAGGHHQFYVRPGVGPEANVVAVWNAARRRYHVKTQPDGRLINNIYGLPRF